MKRFFDIMLIASICVFVLLFVSCDGNGKIAHVKKKWSYDLNSYPGLVSAKDGLLNTKPWDEELFDTLLIKTYSNHNYEAIDYNEAFNIYDAIFKGAAHMVLTSVDSIMRTSVYKNIDYWQRLSYEIANKTAEYQKIYGALESPNSNLQTVDDMIRQYKNILKLSKSTFIQTPRQISAYNVSYKPIEERIKNNRYWNEYFSNNAEIRLGISEFPKRQKAARERYYTELMDEIIIRAREENITKEQLNNAINVFLSVSSSSEQFQRDSLGLFLMGYESDDSQEVSNDLFWR